MSFSMNQAKEWYRWASQKKRNARARGEMGKVPRTMGRRGLAGNVGQPNAREIAQAVYDENMAVIHAADAEEISQPVQINNAKNRNTTAGEPTTFTEYNARANGWSTNPPKQYARPRDPPRRPFILPPVVVGGKSRRTRKAHKRSRHGRTRANRR